MKKIFSDFRFRVMALLLKHRDRPEFTGPVLAEAGISRGMTVLDFGCGPGSFSVEAARIVGPVGSVYAVDVHPLALRSVRRKTEKLGLDNIKTILSECDTGLADESIHIALLYDVFHMLKRKEKVLDEIGRVLKPDGILSFSDHHMKEKRIVDSISAGGTFRLLRRGAKTFSFEKINSLLHNGDDGVGSERQRGASSRFE
jgi:ubiquinone/menaquinone biosynthesis C-methylase UbiE